MAHSDCHAFHKQNKQQGGGELQASDAGMDSTIGGKLPGERVPTNLAFFDVQPVRLHRTPSPCPHAVRNTTQTTGNFYTSG